MLRSRSRLRSAVTDEPTIPFGYKRTLGQLQKGDGIWNGEKFARVRKVPPEVIIRRTKMLYPCALPDGPVAIRRQEVVQPELTMEAANELAKVAAPLAQRALDAMDDAESKLISDMSRSAGATLPTDAAKRKGVPLYSGLMDDFPDALCAVAELSRIGNDQHNPGKPLHWDRSKSGDEADALMRHLLQKDEVDKDGVLHAVKVAWRGLALAQKAIEQTRTKR